ncbi:hypothetical protein FRC03_000971 [Tulasnella sp. 419]|nr:hypothetical protein FRC03_000971 [Tulasnella sp. 419]
MVSSPSPQPRPPQTSETSRSSVVTSQPRPSATSPSSSRGSIARNAVPQVHDRQLASLPNPGTGTLIQNVSIPAAPFTQSSSLRLSGQGSYWYSSHQYR